MKHIFKCYYLTSAHSNDIASSCSFIDEQGSWDFEPRIYEYLAIVMSSDIYLLQDIETHFEIIKRSEANPEQTFEGGGQNFYLEFHANKVYFYHNEFDEEDGWPDLSCSLSMFKSVLIAWNAFLQLPKSIHSVLTTEIKE